VVTTEVGVGTGGSRVRDGSGEPEVTMTGGTTPLGAALAAAPGRPGGDDSAGTGSGGLGGQSAVDEVAAVVAFAGAAPIPPIPPGALTEGGAGDGVPSVQPTVTANGRPRATTLRKMDLGENRTSHHRIERPKSYGVVGFTPKYGPFDRLIS
jgi:hypothetical protein